MSVHMGHVPAKGGQFLFQMTTDSLIHNKICDLLWERDHLGKMVLLNKTFLSWQYVHLTFYGCSYEYTSLVSVYSHKYRADYTTEHYMVHATCYTLQTKVPNGPLSHSWPHLIANLGAMIILMSWPSYRLSLCVVPCQLHSSSRRSWMASWWSHRDACSSEQHTCNDEQITLNVLCIIMTTHCCHMYCAYTV